MLLKDKIAIIYGAGGSIGGTVARAFATAGAKVFLVGRTAAKPEKVAGDIHALNGRAETAIVDALDEKAVNDYVGKVVHKEGKIDISFNAIGLDDVHGTPLVELAENDFTRPVRIAMKTQFITSKAAGRQMLKNSSGVILSITATPAGRACPLVGGFGPACSAIEAFSRNLASELGPRGIRVVCLRSAGSPDSEVFIKAQKKQGTLAKMALQNVIDDTMLGKLPLMAEIANVAAFIVSDKASGMTGTTVNVTCGTTMD